MRTLTTCFLGAVFATALFAQNETAVLIGRVLDPAGLGVAYAQLRLTEKSTGAVRSLGTGDGGFYRFDLLPPGDYSIHATGRGF
jgi:hypothetical protein